MAGISNNLGRSTALGMERVLQSALKGAASAWTAARCAGRVPSAGDLRGRTCHCDPNLPVHLMHSEGLREACDFVVDFGTNVRSPDRAAWPVAKLAQAARSLPRGAPVYVKTNCLWLFVQKVLPNVREPIVLVTGDSDLSPVLEFSSLLDDRRVGHWFAQNCDRPGRHPRLTRIPIGIDNPIFTKVEKRLGFMLTVALGRSPFDPTFRRNDMGDQRALQRVRATLPPHRDRPARVLCTFHQNQKLVRPDLGGLPDRAAAFSVLSGRACCHFPGRRLPQEECWRTHGEFAFEASPQGNGLDCFRTWEALFLGTIPIVRKSTLDPLFEDQALPVVTVDSWDEVTPANLERWRAAFSGLFGPGLDEKLSLPWWISRLRQAAAAVRGGGDRSEA
jgi:hypothetical protein